MANLEYKIVEKFDINEIGELSGEETHSESYDDFIVQLGEFGRYQKLIYLLTVLPVACGAFAPMSTVFTFGEQLSRCSIKNMNNDTYFPQNVFHARMINWSIPANSECERYQHQANETYGVRAKPRLEKCETWVYDKTVLESTVISEMNLVCDDFIYQSHAGMVYFGGLLCGAFIMGIFADIIGRKPVLCLCIVVMLISNLSLVWIPGYIGYVILRFIAGLVNVGCFDTAFVLGLEMVGPSKRVYTGNVTQLIWCLGEVYLLIAAYFVRNWRYLQLAFSIPIVLMALYCWIIPESPRWLISKGQTDKAMAIIHKAAKRNNAPLPGTINFYHQRKETSLSQILESLKSPRLLGRLAIMSTNWIIIAMGYFGLTLNTGRLGGDVYINFLATIIVEFIGYVLCLLLMDRIGRRPLLCGSTLLGGVACICTIFTTLYADESLHWITIVLSNVGKCGISAAFALIYVFTPELFPTTNRSFVLGIANMAGRIGAMASPYIASLGQIIESQFGRALPVIVFGSVMILCGMLSLLLPETMNKKLPENVQQAKELGKLKETREKNKSIRT